MARQWINHSGVVVNEDGSESYALHSGVVFSEDTGTSITAALTGTATATIDEADGVAGGKTVILSITGDTFVAAGATFDAERQNIIDGLTSAQSETLGFNNEIRDKMAVTDVVRTGDTTVTITLPAAAAYDITAQERIEDTLPASVLVLGTVAVVATPTFTIDFVATSTLHQTTNYQGMNRMNGAMR